MVIRLFIIWVYKLFNIERQKPLKSGLFRIPCRNRLALL